MTAQQRAFGQRHRDIVARIASEMPNAHPMMPYYMQDLSTKTGLHTEDRSHAVFARHPGLPAPAGGQLEDDQAA